MSQLQQIIDTARDLYLKYGIRNVTMDDVAKALGISKKTLYQHIETKAELVDKITDQYLDQKKRAMTSTKEEATDAIDELMIIGRLTSQSLRGMQSNIMFALKRYYRPSWLKLQKHFKVYVHAAIRDNIIRGQKEGVYRKEIDPDMIAKFYIGKTMIIADEEVFPELEYDLHTVYNEYYLYHIHGIASEKGLERLKTWKSKL